MAGNTVYTLKPSKTPCTAACLKEWPPVLLPHGVTTPTAGTGVDASKLGTVAAAHHAHQITYSGKRLYWYVDDKSSGQVHGNVKNKWGKWSTVAVTASAAREPERHRHDVCSGHHRAVDPTAWCRADLAAGHRRAGHRGARHCTAGHRRARHHPARTPADESAGDPTPRHPPR